MQTEVTLLNKSQDGIWRIGEWSDGSKSFCISGKDVHGGLEAAARITGKPWNVKLRTAQQNQTAELQAKG